MSAALLALMWGCGGGDEIGSGAPGDTVAGGSARTGVSAREEAGAPDGDSGDARGDAAAGAKAGRRKPRNEQPDLLLVSLDTLRADRLHCYGNENATSPNIDFFANKGLRFAACIAPSPNTAPSHMTLFTGISPLAHGVRNTSVGDESLTRVNATIPLISELVQEAGYQTLSVREHGQLDGRKGFDRGFDESRLKRGFGRIIEETDDALANADPKRPLFAFVHTYEPHAPYLPPAEYEGQKFRGRFTKDGYHGEFRRRYDEMSKKSGHDTASAGAFLKNPEGMTDEDVEFIRGLYDENVLWTDSGFGRLIRTWSQHRRLSNTILVIVSDHGEQLGEHGWFGHGVGAYAELTRVPLIIVVPKGPNGVIETPVELAAVPATILELLGLDPTPDMEPSLMPLLGKAVEPRAETFFFDVDGPNWSALHLERQVVLSPPRNARDSVYTDWNAYMWNFEEDPGGIIPRKLDEEATRLRDLLLDRAARDLEYQAERPLVTIAREEDAGERALLEELGYVGHSDEGDDGAPPPNDPPNGGGR